MAEPTRREQAAERRKSVANRLGEFPKPSPHQPRRPEQRLSPGVATLQPRAQRAIDVVPGVRYHVSLLQGTIPEDSYLLIAQERGEGLHWDVDGGVMIKTSLIEEVVAALGELLAEPEA